MAIELTTTADSGDCLNILVFSRSGLGKTTLCKTAKKPVIISTESGLVAIAEYDLPVIKIKTEQDLEDAYTFIKKDSRAKRFDTVCLDSLSDIAEAILSDNKKGSNDPRRAYGETNDFISKMIRKFRDLDKYVYFIAKAEMFENAAGIQCMRGSMPGKTLTNDLPYFFDIVACLRLKDEEDNESERYLQTYPSLTLDAKDRSGCLSREEKPDLAYCFDKVVKGLAKKRSKLTKHKRVKLSKKEKKTHKKGHKKGHI